MSAIGAIGERGAIGAALATGLHPIASANSASGDAKNSLTKVPSAVAAGAQDVACARCASSFSCGANASYCWCQRLAPLDLSRRSVDLLGRGCLCLHCLRAVIAAQAAA